MCNIRKGEKPPNHATHAVLDYYRYRCRVGVATAQAAGGFKINQTEEAKETNA